MKRRLASIVLTAFACTLSACGSSDSSGYVDVSFTPTQPIAPANAASTTTAGPTTTIGDVVQPVSEWAPTEPCTVSALLVPSCGAWLGATTPSRYSESDYPAGLAEYEAAAQNQPDIMHFYKRDEDVFPTAQEIALAERPGQQRSILFYNWKPSTSLSWRQVADGGADASIDAVAASIGQYPHTLFLAVWHEPENDQDVLGSAADYVAMYRHVVGRLRDLGVTNAVYVMNYMGFALWADVVSDFYPGDDVVDWIAYDPYGFGSHNDLDAFLNEAAEGWPGFYTWARRKAPDKPIMLGEWGIALDKQPRAPKILDGGVKILQHRLPQIKAVVYWHDYTPPDGLIVRLDESTELGIAYADAYRRFANDPYFNSTDTSQAP